MERLLRGRLFFERSRHKKNLAGEQDMPEHGVMWVPCYLTFYRFNSLAAQHNFVDQSPRDKLRKQIFVFLLKKTRRTAQQGRTDMKSHRAAMPSISTNLLKTCVHVSKYLDMYDESSVTSRTTQSQSAAISGQCELT